MTGLKAAWATNILHVFIKNRNAIIKGCQKSIKYFSLPTPVVYDWVNQSLGIPSPICATGHIKDPMPFVEKSRASCPSGRVPPSFIHQVIIISGLNKL